MKYQVCTASEYGSNERVRGRLGGLGRLEICIGQVQPQAVLSSQTIPYSIAHSNNESSELPWLLFIEDSSRSTPLKVKWIHASLQLITVSGVRLTLLVFLCPVFLTIFSDSWTTDSSEKKRYLNKNKTNNMKIVGCLKQQYENVSSSRPEMWSHPLYLHRVSRLLGCLSDSLYSEGR